MMERLEKIRTACEWVSAKGVGGKDSCRVSTSLKWADWDKKVFSPAMCVLWWGEVKSRGGEYDTFWIPTPDLWIEKVAQHLDTSQSWVENFVSQCCQGRSKKDRWTVSLTFDGVTSYRLNNPKIVWKKEELSTEEFFEETNYCLDKYGEPQSGHENQSYWTADPPVSHYESKLKSAVLDLFDAREAARNMKEFQT